MVKSLSDGWKGRVRQVSFRAGNDERYQRTEYQFHSYLESGHFERDQPCLRGWGLN